MFEALAAFALGFAICWAQKHPLKVVSIWNIIRTPKVTAVITKSKLEDDGTGIWDGTK